MSDSPGLEDFGYQASELCSQFTLLANEFLLGNLHCNQSCSLVHASCSLHEWEAVKLTFFAPCLLPELVNDIMS